MAYVTVAVPAHLLCQVYGLLLEDLEHDAAAPSEDGVPVRGNGSWTQAELAELSRRLTHPGGRAIMDAIASAGLLEMEISYEDLRAAGASGMEDSGFTFGQLRAQLAWIARYSKKIRGGVKQWPMEVSDRGRAHEPGQRYFYAMPKLVAAWWLDLSAGR